MSIIRGHSKTRLNVYHVVCKENFDYRYVNITTKPLYSRENLRLTVDYINIFILPYLKSVVLSLTHCKLKNELLFRKPGYSEIVVILFDKVNLTTTCRGLLYISKGSFRSNVGCYYVTLDVMIAHQAIYFWSSFCCPADYECNLKSSRPVLLCVVSNISFRNCCIQI